MRRGPGGLVGAAWAVVAILGCAAPARDGTPPAPSAPATAALENEAVLLVAREVIDSARYATLVSLGPDGHPHARVVDPFPPDSDLAIMVATNARTRKATEFAADARATLLYFDAAGGSYVTVLGHAELVRDSLTRSRYWKEDWAAFYRNRNLGDDYLLIRIRPFRLEVSSERHGVLNDAATWRPVIVNLR